MLLDLGSAQYGNETVGQNKGCFVVPVSKFRTPPLKFFSLKKKKQGFLVS